MEMCYTNEKRFTGLTSRLVLSIFLFHLSVMSVMGAHSAGADSSPPLVFYLGGVPVGFVPDESIRITVVNPDQPQSQAGGGRKYKMLVAPLILNAQGEVLASADEVEIESGEFHSFDFSRNNLNRTGEPGTGRVEVRVQLRYRFFSVVDRSQLKPENFPVSLELLDSSGRTVFLQPNAFQIISSGREVST